MLSCHISESTPCTVHAHVLTPTLLNGQMKLREKCLFCSASVAEAMTCCSCQELVFSWYYLATSHPYRNRMCQGLMLQQEIHRVKILKLFLLTLRTKRHSHHIFSQKCLNSERQRPVLLAIICFF